MNEAFLKILLGSKKTVFSFKDLKMRLRSVSAQSLRSKLSYYVKRGYLYRIRRGLYAKNADYNRRELATKIFKPSYISFETVLLDHGIIFQFYTQIFVATYQSEEIVCDDQTYVFRRIKPPILVNHAGVTIGPLYSIATLERAFLDTVYIHTRFHFDNLEPLDWDKVYELLPIYGDNKLMKKRVDMYYNRFKEEMPEDA